MRLIDIVEYPRGPSNTERAKWSIAFSEGDAVYGHETSTVPEQFENSIEKKTDDERVSGTSANARIDREADKAAE